jgi:uroporphyrinogen decarboxylase
MDIMNERERFSRIMQFQKVDRVPNYELGLLKGTAERWYSEGLPSGVDWKEHFEIGDFRHTADIPNMDMIPPFEQKLVEETDSYKISIGADGIKAKHLKTDEVFMPQFLEYPVKNLEDFRNLKKRYDVESPGRYPSPEEWAKKVETWKKRDHQLRPPAHIGAYWTLRKWLGTKNLSMAFHRQPHLVHEMMDFLADYSIGVLDKAAREVDFDFFNFPEDFAYKGAPLISPGQFREFFLPFYRQLTGFLRGHGIEIFNVDSDGSFDVLIPLLLEGGVTGIWPLEQAAGPEMNPVALRKKYGKDLALMGGIDKRVLAKDKKSIEVELTSKLPYLLSSGGYIPFIDHNLPPNIPFANFEYYMELKKELLEKYG